MRRRILSRVAEAEHGSCASIPRRLRGARPETLNVVLLDNARCPTTQDLVVPENVIFLFQPPYTPEVNPCERVWQDLKDDLAWDCFPDLRALQARIVDLVRAYAAATLQSLTSYPYIIEAINALSV